MATCPRNPSPFSAEYGHTDELQSIPSPGKVLLSLTDLLIPMAQKEAEEAARKPKSCEDHPNILDLNKFQNFFKLLKLHKIA